MQIGEGYEELEKCGAYDIIDLGKDFKDFSDTAAAVDNMDLIITNDTSLVHLAGAMGKPTFLLLPYECDWRWQPDITKCSWYDSVKIFKQTTEDDWDEVMDRVRVELEKLV